MQVSADMHAIFTALSSLMLSHSLLCACVCVNHEASPLTWFTDDEEEELSENETPKVKKKKKAKKSRESKGSKRRSRREVKMRLM